MAGRKGRSGRKPIPIEVHLAKGTYRPDRHGPLPAGTPARVVGAVPGDMLTGLQAAGRALVQAHLEAMDDWNPRELGLLRQAGESRDRQVQLQAVLAAEGLVVDGKPHPCLRAERQAGAAVVVALKALDIEPPEAPAARRRA